MNQGEMRERSEKQLVRNRDRRRWRARDDRGEQTARETGTKMLAAFVWQQQAEEPQGHANERKAFQHRGEEGVGWGGLSRAFSRIPEL